MTPSLNSNKYLIGPPMDPRGIIGSVDTRRGIGYISFYENRFSKSYPPRFTITFQASQGWYRKRPQPVVWDYWDPVGNRDYPIIVIVAARDITLKVPKSLTEVNKLGPIDPFIMICRPQDDALIPEPYSSIRLEDLIGFPYLWSLEQPQTVIDIEDLNGEHWLATVRHDETGVVITDNQQRMYIEIRARQQEPSAFWYELLPSVLADSDGIVLRVVRTDNVYLGAGGKWDIIEKSPDILIFDCRLPVSQLALIPPQGAPLPPEILRKFRLNQRALYKIPTRRTRWFITAFEITIAFLPIIGPLYDVAQFMYSMLEHKTFWGERTNQDEVLMLAIGAIFSIGMEMFHAMRAARLNPGPHDPFIAVESEETAKIIWSKIDPALAEAIMELPENEHRQVLKLLIEYQQGNIEALTVIRKLPKALGEAFTKIKSQLSATRWVLLEDIDDIFEATRNLEFQERLILFREMIESSDRNIWHNALKQKFPETFSKFEHIKLRRHLEKVFNRDFESFRIRELQAAFLSKPRAGRSVIEYALSQSKGRIHELLRKELGDSYHDLIKQFRKGPMIPQKLASNPIRHFCSLAFISGNPRHPQLLPYYDLIERNRGYGEFYEADHILEDRFNSMIENHPNWQISDVGKYERSQMLALLVPVDENIASQISGYLGYNHRAKTEMLRRLIPNGTENMFTLQQVWDAHVFCYKSLSDNWGVVVKHLEVEFEELASELSILEGHDIPLIFRYDQTDQLFSTQEGWPQVKAIMKEAIP